MSVFGAYARYYDLLYAAKDYSAEASYVDTLLRRWAPEARTLLELGCGTALHASLLAAKGYEVMGIDRSEEMLAAAEKRLASTPGRVRLARGDIRSVRVEESFDAVISLFHVISYQTSNDDLRDAFATARAHLRPGGVFVFDFWYGPAVLWLKPERRELRLENDEIEVVRHAEPVIHANENVVDVSYRIEVREKGSGEVARLQETHRMRYLFLPEVADLLHAAGCEMVAAAEWLTGAEPALSTWGVCAVARAV